MLHVIAHEEVAVTGFQSGELGERVTDHEIHFIADVIVVTRIDGVTGAGAHATTAACDTTRVVETVGGFREPVGMGF